MKNHYIIYSSSTSVDFFLCFLIFILWTTILKVILKGTIIINHSTTIYKQIYLLFLNVTTFSSVAFLDLSLDYFLAIIFVVTITWIVNDNE